MHTLRNPPPHRQREVPTGALPKAPCGEGHYGRSLQATKKMGRKRGGSQRVNLNITMQNKTIPGRRSTMNSLREGRRRSRRQSGGVEKDGDETKAKTAKTTRRR
ncbi:hypothetical protein OUZ56_019545 [Daphnia magna]|uniref:Uncharacterized protein n=1 Tax=Daphnia magna TaxID=35525 RepID=A0ABQ9ZBW4_9CRUS|nr:hypothetical protein OUZ56_019545 [Daphnia magna]